MLTSIGRKKPPGDAVDLLTECHGRIREMLALARRIAAEGATFGPDEVAQAAERVRKYFSSSFLLHVRDEEELVAPLLAGFDAAVDAALATMRGEHADHEAPLGRLLMLTNELASHPDRLGVLAAELAGTTHTLTRRLEPHLAAEEAVVFPAFRRFLADELRGHVLDEMRGRRGGHAA